MTQPNNGTNGNGALTVAPQNDAALAMQAAGAPPELVRIASVEPAIAQRAMAIIASRPVDQWTPALHPARAIAAALYEQNTGQVCGRDFYADNRMGIVPGYRGRQKEAADRNIMDYIEDYRMMRPDELEEHEIGVGDTARICELAIPARAKACREAGIVYKPTIGIGIVRAHEKVNKEGKPIRLDGGYDWVRKARNRALKDALSHAGFAKNAREVVEDAQHAGYDLGLDDGQLGKLSREQAVYATETAKRKQEQAYQQAEAQAAALLAQAQADAEDGEIIEPDAGPFADVRAFLNANPPCAVPEAKRAEWAKGCLRLLWGQNRELRDAFLTWAFGTANADALTVQQCAGIIEFVKPAKVGDEYVPDDKAIAFAGQFRAHLEGPDDADAFGDE